MKKGILTVFVMLLAVVWVFLILGSFENMAFNLGRERIPIVGGFSMDEEGRLLCERYPSGYSEVVRYSVRGERLYVFAFKENFDFVDAYFYQIYDIDTQERLVETKFKEDLSVDDADYFDETDAFTDADDVLNRK